MRMVVSVALIVAWGVALVAGVARADDAASVDWGRGLVIAGAVGVADRHAPNPAVARGTSRRVAEDAAKRILSAKVAELPLAAGGKVGDRLVDHAIEARVAAAVDHAIAIDAEPETDGAWHVTLAVPIEAVRQALAGPRLVAKAGDRGPAVVVVDGVTAPPAVGWTVGGVEVATLWPTTVPTWAKVAPRATARRAKAGAIEIAGINATAATLFVIVTGH